MASLVRETNVDFIKWRVPAAAASVVVIVVSWVVLSSRVVRDPGSVLAVDFLGGAASQFSYAAEAPPTDAVRDALAGSGIADAVIQYRRLVSTEVVDPSRREAVGGSAYLQVTTAHSRIGERGVGDAMLASLQSKFPEAGFKLLRTDEVGSQVGADLQRKAVWAVALSLVGIVLYLAVRFELGVALGAVVAVLHDALVAVGVYVLLGRQLNTAMIAAVLTIIGWSVNDTIVIFDRIRENLRKDRTRSFRDLCNWSINQTLGRTLLTSVTVLITVLILLLFGGGAINDFALIMLIGVIAGSYSTIYVATPVVLLWHRNRRPELGRK
jgi:preprotein translocase SecF subunit